MPSRSIKIGVFIPSGAQALDVASVDIFGTMSKEYLSVPPASLMPRGVLDVAPATEITYITTPSQGFDIPLTSSMVVRATHSYKDAAVAPGQLDIVIVPGPHLAAENLAAKFDEGGLTWLRQQSRMPGVNILCICSGILICGAAGIADGKEACGPREMQAFLRVKFPQVNFVGDKCRWVQSGNFWSSGAVTNGNDLMAAYSRSSNHWPPSIVKLGLEAADVGDRDRLYKPEASANA